MRERKTAHSYFRQKKTKLPKKKRILMHYLETQASKQQTLSRDFISSEAHTAVQFDIESLNER